MNIIVQTSDSESSTVAGKNGLPSGFPFLVNDDTGAVIAPVFYFLVDEYLRRNGTWSKNTVFAFADDLKDWWTYLGYAKKEWGDVCNQDILDYRDVMLTTISPLTHQPYADSTIRRRVGTVFRLYAWAKRKGYIAADIEELRPATNARIPSIDTDAFYYLHGSRDFRIERGRACAGRHGSDDFVRPITPSDYRKITSALGSLPSDRVTESRSSRDRLAAELALNTGMRLDEVASLGLWQVLDLRPHFESPTGTQPLRLTRTKGLRPRTVLIPNWLVTELHLYADGERAACIKTAEKHWLKRQVERPKAFFVNRMDSRFRVGRPVQPESLQTAFRLAVINAGLVISTNKTDPETGEQYIFQEAKHSFHDLRHSFATWMYYAEKKAGNSEPWKSIQALLGHAQLSTTLKIYLRTVAIFEAMVSDRVSSYFRSLAQHG